MTSHFAFLELQWPSTQPWLRLGSTSWANHLPCSRRLGEVSIIGQQKLKVFKFAIFPRLTWDLATSDLPISWLHSHLQPVATRFIKRWAGLAKSADPNQLFCPRPMVVWSFLIWSVYHKTHTAKAGSHMYSFDCAVRAITTQKTLHESQLHCVLFRPHQ